MFLILIILAEVRIFNLFNNYLILHNKIKYFPKIIYIDNILVNILFSWGKEVVMQKELSFDKNTYILNLILKILKNVKQSYFKKIVSIIIELKSYLLELIIISLSQI
jgi:hypothetical protein